MIFKMTRPVALLLLPLTIACGRPDHISKNEDGPNNVRSVHPDLEQHVHSFELNWGQRISYMVTFASKDEMGTSAGLCILYSNGGKLVKIQEDYYRAVDFYRKEQLIYHELGHCSLNRDHNDSVREFPEGNFPASTMHSSTFGGIEAQIYQTHRGYYISELFGK